jgi:hypothetical protein
MGILNSKENVFDIIITDKGLQKLVTEGLNVVYYSFSDLEASYNEITTGSTDIPTSKIILEANKSPNDSAMPEYLEDGTIDHYLLHDRSLESLISNGKIFDNFGEQIEQIQDAKNYFINYLENINKEISFKSSLYTEIPEFDDESLILDKNNINFVLDRETKLTFNDVIPEVSTIENISRNYPNSVLTDPKFSNDNNFKKLIPYIKTDKLTKFNLLDDGQIANEQIKLDSRKVVEKIIQLRRANLSSTISFEETSIFNNLIVNFFSVSETLKLLNVIDGGFVEIDDTIKRVLFIGKLLKRSDDVVFFANIFTLLIE